MEILSGRHLFGFRESLIRFPEKLQGFSRTGDVNLSSWPLVVFSPPFFSSSRICDKTSPNKRQLNFSRHSSASIFKKLTGFFTSINSRFIGKIVNP